MKDEANMWHNDPDDVVAEFTPNGREIRRRDDGRFEVQPHNDNCWIVVGTIEAARDAYEHPEKYR